MLPSENIEEVLRVFYCVAVIAAIFYLIFLIENTMAP